MRELNEKLKILLNGIEEGNVNTELAMDIYQESSALGETEKVNLCSRISQSLNGHLFRDIWLNSFMLKIMPSEDKLIHMINHTIETEQLNWQNKYFLFGQFNRMVFMNQELNTENVGIVLWGLLQHIKDICKSNIKIPLQRIPVEERNQDMSIVIVEQFLAAGHGPTKTVLDRCYVLQKGMRKKVLLINTAELMSNIGAVPFFDTVVGNYVPEHLEKTEVVWKGAVIPFFQCEYNMPSITGMEELLEAVIRLKPGSVVLVGGTSLFAGLVNDLIPVVTVGTIQSGLATTLAEYQIIDTNMIDKCTSFANRLGKPDDYIIEGRFTFSLKEQTKILTRQQVGIPENSFVMAAVGGRLTDEITDDFLNHLENIIDDNTYFMIIGGHKNIEQMKAKHPKLSNQIIYMGFCSDVLSRIELCDVYVNPTRRGGGTSCVEAMFKGKPVITVNYGDVAGIVGERFICNDYDEMEQLILKYKNNKDFYQKQSDAAIELANDYLDSEKEFTRIMNEYSKRIDKSISKK